MGEGSEGDLATVQRLSRVKEAACAKDLRHGRDSGNGVILKPERFAVLGVDNGVGTECCGHCFYERLMVLHCHGGWLCGVVGGWDGADQRAERGCAGGG